VVKFRPREVGNVVAL